MSTPYRRKWYNFLDNSGASELSRLRYTPHDLKSEFKEPESTVSEVTKFESAGDTLFETSATERRASFCALQCVEASWGTLGVRHTAGSVVDCSWCHPEPSEDFEGGLQAARYRWSLALEALRDFPVLRGKVKELEGNDTAETLVHMVAGNWPTPGLLTAWAGVPMGMMLWFGSIGYGAVHAAAWHDHFPSWVERLLWRFSAVNIMGSGVVWLLVTFVSEVSPAFDKFWDSILAGHAHKALNIFLLVICSICGLAYCLARLFLVVESVASLRKMPPAMYETPNWSQLIPHI